MDGRQILDSALTGHEFIDSRYKRQLSVVVDKTDFEKAYDMMDWNFLDYMFKHMGFGIKWHGWIHGCVSSTQFSFLVNGSPKGFFRSSRGLHQGDPLSHTWLHYLSEWWKHCMQCL